MAQVTVVGGGICGLACALVAARRGHRVVVLERAAEFAEIGAGIQLAPNAFRALAALGLVEQVRERAVFVEALRLVDATTGDQVARLDLGAEFVDRFGQPYAVVHRHDLYDPLLRTCMDHPMIELRPGSAVTGYERTADGASVLVAGSAPVHSDVVLGADGLRSRIRAQLVGDGGPRISGHTIYRSVVPIDGLPAELSSQGATLWAGPGLHLVHYPIAGTRSLNLALTVDDGADVEVHALPVDAVVVRAAAASAHPDLRAVVELGRDWRTWVLCDRDPVTGWVDGPVALVGDAAHPMLQYAAQGAAMALEDAICLDHLLAGCADDVASVLPRFEALRAPRTARVQRVSRMMGDEIYHPGGAEARERNTRLGALTQDGLRDLVDWLYSADVTTTGTAMAVAG